MILKRIVEHSARWNFEANTWWVGETEYYCWTNMKEKEESPRMRFSEALQWIIRARPRKIPGIRKSSKNHLEKKLLNSESDHDSFF